GGVGKSVVAANLAVALALLGKTTVAIDLDLGGSNLHSFLGLPNKFPGIGDYVKSPDKLLTEFMVSTPYDNLFFIPGDGVSPFMANITFHQKRHLTKEIQNLPADFIIMDLGAGTSFNVLDIFAIGDRGLLVSTPEFPAMVSMLGFLKNLLLRRIERETKKNKKIHLLLDEILRRPLNNEPLSIRMLRDELSEADEEAGELIDEICENSRPGIIFNMGDGPDDLEVIPRFNKGLSKGLSLEADYLGFIFN
ncbi:MAG: MinD/ParA family protein, partial [bacterium]|nr:MinD/ParA family protein [bacterium]